MSTTIDRMSRRLARLAIALMAVSGIVSAQVPVDEAGNPLEPLDLPAADGKVAESASDPISAAELEELIGPIALYPDDLLAIVLPASAYPLQIVQAARFLERYAIDNSLEPDAEWDESVIALLNYPEVIEMLDDDIDWTWRLGEAVIAQQQDVIAAVESFRDRAYAAGNLSSDQYQNVTEEEGVIQITPIEDDVIYVPYYEPQHVLVSQVRPVYHYYPRAYPVYYYPYPYGHSFTTGGFWGVTTAFRVGWAAHCLRVHHSSYWGHPYYGRSYHSYRYRNPSIGVYNATYLDGATLRASSRLRDGDYWRPRVNRTTRQVHFAAGTRIQRRTPIRAADFRRRDEVGRPIRSDVANSARVRPETTRREIGSARDDDLRFRSRNKGRDIATRPSRNVTAVAPRTYASRTAHRQQTAATRRDVSPAPTRSTRARGNDRDDSRSSRSASKQQSATVRSGTRREARSGGRRGKKH